jgi:hypothetical protein
MDAFIASDVCVTRGLRSFYALALIRRAIDVMLVLAEPRKL